MSSVFDEVDYTRYRHDKTEKLVAEMSGLDGSAVRVKDSEVGPGFVSKDVYFSDEYFELEREHLWPRVWQIACREQDVASVGDYIEYNILDDTILVLRSAPDVLRAFFNVCRHRGRKLREGSGNAKKLVCAYHGWSWDLEGNVTHVTDHRDFEPDAICPEDLALTPVLVDTWGGFVFVNMDLNAVPLRDAIAPMPARLDRFRHEDLRYSERRQIVLPINWKTGVESALEIYHQYRLHPEAAFYLDDTRMSTYERWANGITLMSQQPDWLQNLARPSPRLGIDPEPKEMLLAMLENQIELGILSEEELEMVDELEHAEIPGGEVGRQVVRSMIVAQRRGQLVDVVPDIGEWSDEAVVTPETVLHFPNTHAILQLGTGFCMRFRPNGDQHSCIMDYWDLQYYRDGEVPETELRIIDEQDRSVETWGSIISQDMEAMVGIGKALRSRGYQHSRLGYQENNIRFFNRKMAESIGWKTDRRPVY